MTTLVGTQTNIMDALRELLELDYDAVEAYEAAIERLSSQSYKNSLSKYKEDHQRHIEEITNILTQHNEDAPTGPSGKKWLTKGKIIIADLIGDEAILRAILSNEMDTNTAYERMNERDDTWTAIRDILKKGLEDERRHKKGIEDILKSSS